MIQLPAFPWKLRFPSAVLLCGIAFGQFPAAQVLNQDQEIQVHKLPMLVARSNDPDDVLLTSLDTIFHDHEICCGRDSALGDLVLAADPKSLKDVASRLEGRHLLSDGRSIKVQANYVTAEEANSGMLVNWFSAQRAALMEWNSQVYVVHGIVYRWMASYTPEGSAGTTAAIHKFLLWDTRYSDSRREVVFNRDTDNLGKVQGLLFVQATRE